MSVDTKQKATNIDVIVRGSLGNSRRTPCLPNANFGRSRSAYIASMFSNKKQSYMSLVEQVLVAFSRSRPGRNMESHPPTHLAKPTQLHMTFQIRVSPMSAMSSSRSALVQTGGVASPQGFRPYNGANGSTPMVGRCRRGKDGSSRRRRINQSQ